MVKTSQTSLIAADRLVDVIQQMARKQTNPVIEVLGDQINQLQLEKKYPQPPLDFQQGPWRAFYHCHAVPDSQLAEHGHFHIFTHYHQQWTHVAALSMDSEGQPQAWLAVNRWVTDGPWLAAAQLIQHLNTVAYTFVGLSLLEDWLLSMLQLFSNEISVLLESRDKALSQLDKNSGAQVLLNNRDIYTLATHNINLLTKLNSLYPQAERGEI